METLNIPAGAENPTATITIPEEGENVTAARANPGDGPVRLAFLGVAHKFASILRGRLSFKSITVDVTGEQVIAGPSPGRIACANLTASAAVSAVLGFFSDSIETLALYAIGAAGRIDYESARVRWRNTTTGATGANPPFATAISNEQRALNLIKAFGHVSTDGAGGYTLFGQAGQTFNIKDATLAASYVEFEMAAPMSDANYTIIVVGSAGLASTLNVFPSNISTTKFRLNTPSNNPTNTVLHFHFLVLGRQDT